MISTTFEALFQIGLPVFLLGFYFVCWSAKKGYLSLHKSSQSHDKHLAVMKRKIERDKSEKSSFVSRWMMFGGGFYGAAALYTYSIVELGEILSFVFKMLNPANWSFDIGIDLLISFAVNSLENLLLALLWFDYWGDTGFGVLSLVWIGMAYVAFWAGTWCANDFHRHENNMKTELQWPTELVSFLRSIKWSTKPADRGEAAD